MKPKKEAFPGSFGSVVAYQMALLEPKTFRLVLLDGSPSQMLIQIDDYKEKMKIEDQKEEHIEALISFISQFVPIDSRKVKTELMEINDEDSRNQKAAEIFIENGGSKCEPKEIAFAAKAFFQKIKMLMNYKPSSKLNATTLLIRAEELIVKSSEQLIARDYELSENVSGEVEVLILKGNHKTFLTNNIKEVANIIHERQ